MCIPRPTPKSHCDRQCSARGCGLAAPLRSLPTWGRKVGEAVWRLLTNARQGTFLDLIKGRRDFGGETYRVEA